MHLDPRGNRRRPRAPLGRLAVLSLAFVACQFSGNTTDREPPSIEVDAPSEAACAEVTNVAGRLLPELEDQFGVRSRDLRIVVDLAATTETRGASTSSAGITLFPIGMSWVSGALGHELVHWLLHWHDSYWNTLPIVLEEGLAQLAFHKYSDIGISPDEPVLDAGTALSLTHEEYNSLEDQRPATYTGVLIAQRLGVSRLRGLAMRARAAGEVEIPSQWIIEALAEAWEADGRPSSRAAK